MRKVNAQKFSEKKCCYVSGMHRVDSEASMHGFVRKRDGSGQIRVQHYCEFRASHMRVIIHCRTKIVSQRTRT